MLAELYTPEGDPLELLGRRDRGLISAYARGGDYHDLVKKRLKQLGRWLVAETGAAIKVFVDTAPVMEKPLAARAGLGWQGKHTNLVSREFGSWLFIGAILTTAEIAADAPEEDHCGACRRCLDICPTHAFTAPYEIDARACISYLTIEHKGPIPEEFRAAIGNRIYGCDDCQLVCPWNRYAKLAAEPSFAPRHGLDAPCLVELLAWTETEFLERTAGSAIRRIGHVRWLRNVAIALGNAPTTPEAIAALEARRDHPSDVVREAVGWALSRQRERAVTAAAAVAAAD
jgi:epoxyqueuosine reductase